MRNLWQFDSIVDIQVDTGIDKFFFCDFLGKILYILVFLQAK